MGIGWSPGDMAEGDSGRWFASGAPGVRGESECEGVGEGKGGKARVRGEGESKGLGEE